MPQDWVERAQKLRAELRQEFPGISGGDRRSPPYEEDEDDRPSPIRLRRQELRPQLFDYQADLAEAVARLESAAALLALPTGAGKTRTAVAAVFTGIAKGTLRRVIWLAPSVELVDQAFETFERLWLYQGDVDEVTLTPDQAEQSDAPLVAFSTPQAVYSRSLRRRAAAGWDMVIFDEAHQLGARTFRGGVKWLRSLQESDEGTSLLGLSATPGRVDPSETEDLVSYFGGQLLRSRILAPNPVKVLQRRGVLANLRFAQLTRSLVPAADEPVRIRIAARACAEFVAGGRRPLVFTASVAGAVVLAEILRSLDVRAAHVHAGMARTERRQLIEQFATGRVDVLTNQRLLATGYDCPAISDVLILGKVGSPILFEQIVGRAARGPQTGGSSTATIWDFDNHLAMHGLPPSYYRYRDYDWE